MYLHVSNVVLSLLQRFELQPLLSVFLILASTIVSLLPTILAGSGISGSESATNIFAWTVLNAASQVPSAMAQIAAQAYLMRAGALLPGPVGSRASAVGVFRFVFYNQASQSYGGLQ
jgi:hypothetical protein